ncbi:MAG: hypothetical protein COX81_00080 [Candidatus Magasanikbacteria bacterium CG_4_10_14_0_2_um_filter_37_12]|uniref:THIF-type NAD/FAD binding fold domain-containing protein n=1 Tax=Candidatus Magasanikbacteria bacterium CG_4_10_14_0_2_um_filter_37_12 TaxID=1974637 RepID=A0A2M7VAH2_9BACT|nr:MAG: hypothetical protein COX81_00080 [Candidatus Magasanikbacteria bacterium CG_4_10_14_0_2_um_filter_37_12]
MLGEIILPKFRKHYKSGNHPIIFDLKKSTDVKKIKKLLSEYNGIRVVDEFSNQVQELREVNDPGSILKDILEMSSPKISDADGVWVFYPWNLALVHVLSKSDFLNLKHSRNNNLISKEEQKQTGMLTVGFAGMNVGNSGAICMALEGVGFKMKFADFDTLSLSNLNRFRASLTDLGTNKTTLSARQVYEINPFLKIEQFDKGISEKNIDKFLLNSKIDILVEEVDNLPLKLELRKRARKHKIPVVMVTGNGSNLILDIERFDKDAKTPILNGKLTKTVQRKVSNVKHLSKKEIIYLLRDFIGKEFLTERLCQSFDRIGVDLAGIPQLAEATFLRGAVLTYVVRKIFTDGNISSGRYNFCLDGIIKM